MNDKKYLFDYKNNIKIVTTVNGDKVITMNPEILTSIKVALYEAVEHQLDDDREATANDTKRLIDALDK